MEKITFDHEEALELLKLMVSTNTVNGNEIVLERKLKEILEKEGLECEIDEFGPNGRANMVVKYPGLDHTKPVLAMTGHMDTVPVGQVQWEHEPFACEIADGMLYGRGAADMKGGDAACLYAMLLMKRAGVIPKQDLIYIATAGEETLSLGAHRFVEQGGMQNVGALIVCEPSGLKQTIAHKGAIWVKVEFFGKTAHGSMPHLGINALLQMTRFVEALRDLPFATEPDPELGMPTVSVNKCVAGAATNVVPDHAEVELDYRTIPGQTWEDIKSHIERALALAAEGDKDFNARYAYMGKVLAPVACPSKHHIMDALDEAAGRKLVRKSVNFFTDASVLVEPGLPVVIFGLGEDDQAHKPNEHIPLEQFYEAINIYYNFMKDYEV